MIQRRNGTIKNNRQGKNLLDSQFKMDQRPFWEILGYITSFLEKVNYYNLQNQQEGNWKVLIEGDPIIYMTMIINHPTKDIEELIALYEDGALDEAVLEKGVEVLVDWYNRIDGWQYQLLYMGEKKLSQKIKNIVVDVLLPEKNKLTNYKESQGQHKSKDQDEQSLDLRIMPIPSPSGEVQPKKILNTFHRIIIHIKEFVKEYLQQHIYDDNQHRPNNAMYIAFVLLFKRVQEQLNEFSQKHLEFYYKDVLKQELGKGQSTRAIVNFELLPTIPSSLIPKGTLLSAGKPFGGKTDVFFEVCRPLMAHNIALTQMQSLFLKTSPLVDVGTNEPLILYTAKNDMIIDGVHTSSKEDWFVFGANKHSVQNTGIPKKRLTNLGFIIGSPALFLSEGHRKIEITINLEEATSDIFWQLLNQIKDNKGTSMDVVFHKVFAKAFNISFSSANGWIDFEEYTVNYNEKNNSFSINLVLGNGDPKLERSEKTKESLTWPSIKITLNEYAPIYVYSFFKGVKIDTIQIGVDVHGIKDATLYNNIGKMPLGKPFDIFGPAPNMGGYLIIGKSELFQKKVDTLSVFLDWENIPSDYGGFDTYYSGYPNKLGNESFKVSFSALSNGHWLPTEDSQTYTFDLFQTRSCVTPEGYPSEQLEQTTKIKVNGLDTIIENRMVQPISPLLLTVNSQTGFIKLTLLSPNEGFGAKAYGEEYLKVATYNARAIVKNKPQIPFPNKPFVPKVKGISLNYKASDTLFFKPDATSATNIEDNVGEFIHITPFGTETIIQRDKGILKHTLMPSFEAEGYLFLGFSGVKDQTTVSLYFHFLHSSTAVDLPPNGLIWEYYHLNEWIRLEATDIILDDTNGFTKSGIVEMIFPKKEVDKEERIGGKIYWIRISTKSNSIHYPKIKGIYLNAVETVCLDQDVSTKGMEIPANSIVKLAGKLPDVKKVNQPAVSFGGIPEEKSQQFYTRVSERLRHKSRALTLWDYERLVLENFEEVLVAKCTNLDDSFKPVPGVVKIIVLSSKWTNDERNYFDGETLNRIKIFLQGLASPFANITVMNPRVEYLLVRCVVKFKVEDNGGYYINKLNDDISNFLSPITNIDNGNGGIGGNIVPTMLVSHIEKCSYMAMVRALSIEHIVRKGADMYSLGVYSGGQEITTTTPEAILSPVVKHQIISVQDQTNVHNLMDVGIGTMEIGLDFILGDSNPTDLHRTTMVTKVDRFGNRGVTDNAILVFKNKTKNV